MLITGVLYYLHKPFSEYYHTLVERLRFRCKSRFDFVRTYLYFIVTAHFFPIENIEIGLMCYF